MFNSNAIDFVITYNKLNKKYGPVEMSKDKYGAPVIKMANNVIGSCFSKDSIKGVKLCLEYEIRNIKPKTHLWKIPIYTNKLYINDDTVSLLADSVILNIVGYRGQLDEVCSGLSILTLSDMVKGFEYVCGWLLGGIAITYPENEFISYIDVDNVSKWIR